MFYDNGKFKCMLQKKARLFIKILSDHSKRVNESTKNSFSHLQASALKQNTRFSYFHGNGPPIKSRCQTNKLNSSYGTALLIILKEKFAKMCFVFFQKLTTVTPNSFLGNFFYFQRRLGCD